MEPQVTPLMLATARVLAAEAELIRSGFDLVDLLEKHGRPDMAAELAGSLTGLRLTMQAVYGAALPDAPAPSTPPPVAAGVEG